MSLLRLLVTDQNDGIPLSQSITTTTTTTTTQQVPPNKRSVKEDYECCKQLGLPQALRIKTVTRPKSTRSIKFLPLHAIPCKAAYIEPYSIEVL
jgi:hypothetical protein